MAKYKILTNFSRNKTSLLLEKASSIVKQMTGNPNFENPIPSLAEIEAAINILNEANIAAQDGNKTAKIIRDEKHANLASMLYRLALYTEMQASDNLAILSSSGFSLRKRPEPIGILEKPKGFNVQPTHKGSIKLKLSAIRGAKSYLYLYKKETDENWTTLVGTSTNISINNLESGVAYLFKVAGVGSAKEQVFSNPIKSFIL
ncbi:hypothetical protein GGR32_001089 [Mesonia hippocampi]|uniref:Fibronectin type-III domain-containing protein n=1 Tax=Mesonia hippocampi TaxID=1628250 RepID=A0A840EKA7_9FLAO|nr:fibronectin type III domain-containing protein [Mesonia hippocampi]MBB4118809.1 hypothetical protein [Mesonia hippocampi]